MLRSHGGTARRWPQGSANWRAPRREPLWTIHVRRKLPVGPRFADRNLAQRTPHLLLKLAAVRPHRQSVERMQIATEIRCEQPFQIQRIGAWLELARAEPPLQQRFHAILVARKIEHADSLPIGSKQNAPDRRFKLIVVQQHASISPATIPTDTSPHRNATAATLPRFLPASGPKLSLQPSTNPDRMPETHPDRPVRAWQCNSPSMVRFPGARTSVRSFLRWMPSRQTGPVHHTPLVRSHAWIPRAPSAVR